MTAKILLAALAGILLAGWASCADDDLVKGFIEWEPGLRRDANEVDKTDYWSAIAISPSTGKYGVTCWVTTWDLAMRIARDNCNAKDARAVVVCGNGWCALALGDPPASGNWAWGVGWARSREKAEQFALERARERAKEAKVVFSINAREFHAQGAIAYSPRTGKSGYSCSYGRGDITRAVKFCGDPAAKSFVTPKVCSWMALVITDDRNVYGFGWAGNRTDAEATARKECGERPVNPRVALSFCTNGVEGGEK
jgi:hypothetical protein